MGNSLNMVCGSNKVEEDKIQCETCEKMIPAKLYKKHLKIHKSRKDNKRKRNNISSKSEQK